MNSLFSFQLAPPHLALDVMQYVIVPVDVNVDAVLPQQVIDQEKRARRVTVVRKAAGGKEKKRKDAGW